VSLHHCVDHGCRIQLCSRFADPSPKFSRQVYQWPGYDEDADFRPGGSMLDSQTISLLLLGTIGVISGLGLIGTVLAFWSMGRASYRKD
jgi:hypothetical protein